MSYNYEVLKNRMNNGTPFQREAALKRINALANEGIHGTILDGRFGITQEEATELTELVYHSPSGYDTMPQDMEGRLSDVEAAINAIIQKEEVPNA